jgi:cobalt-zinc-cadmium efflux system outer membrane protein
MHRWLTLVLVALLPLAGCALPHGIGRAQVADKLAAREPIAGVPTSFCPQAAAAALSGRVLTEDEAVALSLSNNAGFQELLVELDLARADLIVAGQLTNPEIWTVFPVGAKQFEFALNVPLEALWLRPHRISAAQWQARRIGERLVQDGLNTIRDVRTAWAELVLAHDRLRLAHDGAELRQRIANLAEARLRAGDASELELSAVRVDALLARQEAEGLEAGVEVAQAKLATLLGVPCAPIEIDPIGRDVVDAGLELEPLVCEALQTRPDLTAADLAVVAADERARLARYDRLRVVGVLPDINGKGRKGFEAGPGVLLTVPIFHQNQGAVARAEAELEKAQRQYDTLADAVVVEVRQAYLRWRQAGDDLAAWDHQLLPLTRQATEQAERAYERGGESLLLVLETTRHALAAQSRRVESQAEARRQAAELERAVGRRLFYASGDTTVAPELLAPPEPEAPGSPEIERADDVRDDGPTTEPRLPDAGGTTLPRLRLLESAAGERPTEFVD